ncbi:MAG TPA: hypothetical protein VGW33_14635 [Terriglobia bacterium]|nr:hypothetical protein [Terriglobia bacterium]
MYFTAPGAFRAWLSGITIAAAVLAEVASVPLAGAVGRKVIGVVLTSTAARSASAPLIEGATLTSGDSVHTERGGSARVRLGRDTQVSLGAATAVRFESNLNRVVVKMSAGAMMARETGHDAVAVETAGFRVEPAEQGRAVYVVAMLSDKTDVAARLGKLVITDVDSGRRTLVSEGEVAEIAGAPSAPQEQESGKPAPAKTAGQEPAPEKTKPKNHNGIIILAGAAAAAVGIGLAAAGGGGGQPPASPAAP